MAAGRTGICPRGVVRGVPPTLPRAKGGLVPETNVPALLPTLAGIGFDELLLGGVKLSLPEIPGQGIRRRPRALA